MSQCLSACKIPWTLIKVGRHYHLFGDYDSADHIEQTDENGAFPYRDLNKQFKESMNLPIECIQTRSVGFAKSKVLFDYAMKNRRLWP